MMKLSSTELIRLIDEFAEFRDLTAVALMAVNDIEREARGPLLRLLGLICDKMDSFSEKLDAAHEASS